jgi:hypothetical protein
MNDVGAGVFHVEMGNVERGNRLDGDGESLVDLRSASRILRVSPDLP